MLQNNLGMRNELKGFWIKACGTFSTVRQPNKNRRNPVRISQSMICLSSVKHESAVGAGLPATLASTWQQRMAVPRLIAGKPAPTRTRFRTIRLQTNHPKTGKFRVLQKGQHN
jgi:hypothetical protein